MPLKKCQKYFKGFLFLSTRANLIDCYVKLDTSSVLLQKGNTPVSLALWLGEKNKQGWDSLESGKPGFCCLGGMFPWAKWSLSFISAENWTLAPSLIKQKQKFLLPRGNEMFK